METSYLAQNAVVIARGYLGVKEATGHNDGPFIEGLQRWMDNGAGWMEGQPWCATFASYCIARAAEVLGVEHRLPKFAATSDIYSWFKTQGLLLPGPIPNSIGMLKGDGGTPGKTHHHTFFVEGIDGEYVCGIDGNWQNAVSKSRHLISDCDFGPIV